jgi:hypothetical protein
VGKEMTTMKKYFTDREYAAIIAKIMAMDLLVRSFNDEEYIESWLMNGVPDGLDDKEDYEDIYPNNKDLEQTYTDLATLFCRLIARQAASIQMPEKGTDFPPILKVKGGGIII